MKFQIALAAGVLASLSLAGHAQAAEASQASLVSQAKITRAAAEKIALSKIPSGTVKSAELEQEHGALVWSFDIVTPKSHDIHEILVNAKTAAIVHAEIETPKAQATEAAADKLEKAKHRL
jgi:uncharacterized membrane protein YkoI